MLFVSTPYVRDYKPKCFSKFPFQNTILGLNKSNSNGGNFSQRKARWSKVHEGKCARIRISPCHSEHVQTLNAWNKEHNISFHVKMNIRWLSHVYLRKLKIMKSSPGEAAILPSNVLESVIGQDWKCIDRSETTIEAFLFEYWIRKTDINCTFEKIKLKIFMEGLYTGSCKRLLAKVGTRGHPWRMSEP